MKYLEFIALLEQTVTQLATTCPGSKFAVVGTIATSVAFRNTPMTDDECGGLFDAAASMAHLGKGVFIQSSHTKLLDAIRDTYEGSDEEYQKAILMVDKLFKKGFHAT
jgi:hypothetical protein